MSNYHFEASGDLSQWPKNEYGKPTHVAVFGVLHPTEGKQCRILWTGDFPDLQPAMYWAAKKELEAVRKDKWMLASRVIWQHNLKPEQAVAVCFREMEPQIDIAIHAAMRGEEPEIGDGPMKPVDYSKVEGHVVELEGPDGEVIDLQEFLESFDPDNPLGPFGSATGN
jgi:hypothetical protein